MHTRIRAIAVGALITVVAAAVALIVTGLDDAAPGPHPAPATSRTTRSSSPRTTPPAVRRSAPTLPPAVRPLLAADRPIVNDPHIRSWTLLDVATNTVLGQHRCIGCTNHAASTIKVWLAGDALRRAGPNPATNTLRDVDAAIIDSDNAAATRLFRAGGGRDGLWRLVYTCHLTRTLPNSAWGATELTSGDLAGLGACAARGQVAGDIWTTHLLDRMRAVRGAGRFGPVTALPDADVALKNGWLIVAGEWHVNCLAIIDGTWSLGILTRYPASLGLDHGADLCAEVTRTLAYPTSSHSTQEIT